MATELKPCPKCGSKLLYRGVAYRLTTPKFWVRLKSRFKKGVTCFMCGYHKPSAKAWNRRAEDETG